MRVAATTRRASRSAARFDVDIPVSEVMVPEPVSVGADLSAALARLLMLDQSVGALPVVDEVGRPIGMLSKTDIVRRTPSVPREDTSHDDSPLCRPSSNPDPDSEEGSLRALQVYMSSVDEPSVGDLMTPVVVSVPADTPVVEAARLMLEHEVHHLPVVGRRGQLIGVVAAFDFVRAVARLPRTEPAGPRPRAKTGSERPRKSASERPRSKAASERLRPRKAG
jgi:CBS domain-containing protein